MIQRSQEIREIWSSFALQVPANAICKEKVPTIFKSKRYTVFFSTTAKFDVILVV